MSAGPVVVFSERADIALELLTPALAMGAGPVVALDLGAAAHEAEAEAFFEYGADRVVAARGEPGARPDAAALAAALAHVVTRLDAGVVILGATRDGSEIAARLAQRLDVACASACTSLELSEGALVVERRCLGRFVERRRIESRPALATWPPGRSEPPPRDPSRRAAVETWAVAMPDARVRVTKSRPRPSGHVDIEKARVVVAVGRGLRRPEDIALAANLARVLGGEVGASRPLTDYLEWLPADVKVGLSGHTVRPDLYVACGISGQVEHVVGMREARVVVAINIDPGAPIHREADHVVIGDLYAILPALTRHLAALAR